MKKTERSVYDTLDEDGKVAAIKEGPMAPSGLVAFLDVKMVKAEDLPAAMPDITGITLPIGVDIEILSVVSAIAARPGKPGEDPVPTTGNPNYYFIADVPGLGITRIPCTQLVQPVPTEVESFKKGQTPDNTIFEIQSTINNPNIYKPSGAMGQDAANLVGKKIKVAKVFKNVKKFQAASTRPGSTWNKDGVLTLTLTFLEKLS
jgi:hypothetical protein